MNLGALLGGFAGFFLGFFGFHSFFLALLFSLLGSSLLGRLSRSADASGARGRFGSSGWSFHSEKDSAVFSESLFSMLGCVAMADGDVTPEEEQVFRNLVIQRLHIHDPASVARAMQIFRQATQSSQPIDVYAQRAASTFRNRPQILEMMLLIMIQVAVSDGAMHAKEDELIAQVVRIFGFSQADYATLKNRFGFWQGSSGYARSGPSSDYGSGGGFSSDGDGVLRSAYETLGVTPDASESVVRQAYRKKVAEYHPDKIAGKGLPAEFMEFASEKFQEIQTAWEKIRQAKGY